MVNHKGIFIRKLMVALVLVIAVALHAEAGSSRIAYKKPIYGKSNVIKEKRVKHKPALTGTTTTAATVTTTVAIPTTPPTTSAPIAIETTIENDETTISNENYKLNDSTIVTTTEDTGTSGGNSWEVNSNKSDSDDNQNENFTDKTAEIIDDVEQSESLGSHVFEEEPKRQLLVIVSESAEDTPAIMTIPSVHISTPAAAPVATTITTTTTTESNLPVPCTCGVFMASQIKHSSTGQPSGTPVITNELDRAFPCNAVGQKQCQTKCLEAIVQHLPNSASILCATLNRDCRKERAYLFVKNCSNHWWNTTLTAGREYCCKNGHPYTCPMV